MEVVFIGFSERVPHHAQSRTVLPTTVDVTRPRAAVGIVGCFPEDFQHKVVCGGAVSLPQRIVALAVS